MVEHYDRIRPGSKIAWPKYDCKPELKIGGVSTSSLKGGCILKLFLIANEHFKERLPASAPQLMRWNVDSE